MITVIHKQTLLRPYLIMLIFTVTGITSINPPFWALMAVKVGHKQFWDISHVDCFLQMG